MQYQIESFKVKKRGKQVIVYVIILLLVLLVSISLGIVVARKGNEEKTMGKLIETKANAKKEEKQEQSKRNNEKQGDGTQGNLENKKQFVKNVDQIYNGEKGKRVFLTFDDGPSEAVTPHILDTLKKYNVKATFFVLGNRVKLNPELIRREYREGHYIANHSYSHEYSKIYKSSNAVLKEYNKTEEQIKRALGNENYSSNLFRFPGGSTGGEYDKVKEKAKKELEAKNIAYLDCNALTSDAAGAYTKEKIMKNLEETVLYNNVVLLMHDAPDKILTYETLEDVIKYLQKKGYTFENMYDLI